MKDDLTNLTNILNNLNSIRRDKCELYGDYIQSLFHIIFDTYLGDEITGPSQQMEHFKWCWDKNRSNFASEGIKFNNSEELYNYFMVFALEVYYPMPFKEESNDPNNKLLGLWEHLMDYSATKNEASMASLVKVYNLFDNALKS